MKDMFSVVKKYVDEYDYDFLLRHGAPKDEFDSETRKICELITQDSSIEEIAEAIATVMHMAFGNEENAEKYLETARKIKGNLQK